MRTSDCRSRMLLDAAPNGANRGRGGGAIKISLLRSWDANPSSRVGS
jgi:hypothetical protein